MRIVFVGFGSMIPGNQRLPDVVAVAARRAGVRAVVQTGWAELGPAGDDILLVGDLPHDWLFPQTAAVVHHAWTASGRRRGGNRGQARRATPPERTVRGRVGTDSAACGSCRDIRRRKRWISPATASESLPNRPSPPGSSTSVASAM
jgi:hypothetical protein